MKIIGLLKQNYWLTAILVLAAFLRLYHLNFQSLWMDEIYTMNVSNPKYSLAEFHNEVVTREGFPYFYFLLLRFLYFIFGYSEIVARLLSAIAGIAGVLAVHKLGGEIFNKNAGLFAAFLLSINDFHIQYSQEARPYALFFLFAVFAFYRLSIFVKKPTVINAIYYGISAGMILNINFFGLITVFSQALILLLYLLLTIKQERVVFFKNSLISGGIALLMFAPNYEIFIKLLNFESFWVPPPQLDSFTILFKEFLGNSEVTMFIFGLLLTYYTYSLFKEKAENYEINSLKKNPLNFSFVLLFFWMVTYFGILMMKSYGGVSLLLDRYFISIVPVFVIVLGIAIELVKNKVAKIAIVLSLLIFGIFNIFGVKKYYKTVSKSQYREVSNFILKNSKKEDTIYTSLYYWYSYYLDNDKVKTNLKEKPLDEIVQEMIQDSTKVKPFWYADAHIRPYNPSETAKIFLAKNFYIENNFDGFDAWTKHFILLKDAKRTVDISKFKEIKKANGSPFNFNIEAYKNENNIVTVSGWAFFDKQPADQTEISLVFIKGQNAKMLQTQKVVRPDISNYFKSKYDLNNSGFISTINTESFENGKYQLAIYIVNKATNKEGLMLTDKVIEK